MPKIDLKKIKKEDIGEKIFEDIGIFKGVLNSARVFNSKYYIEYAKQTKFARACRMCKKPIFVGSLCQDCLEKIFK